MQRIVNQNPECKFIILTRDPSDWFFSLYMHRAPQTFMPNSRMYQMPVTSFDEMLVTHSLFFDFSIIHGHFDQIIQKNVLTNIKPQQVLLLDQKQMCNDIQSYCDRIFRFLDVDIMDVKPHELNPTVINRNDTQQQFFVEKKQEFDLIMPQFEEYYSETNKNLQRFHVELNARL